MPNTPVPHASVKIYGERNSATNALRQLLLRNTAARMHPSILAELDAGARRWIRRPGRLPMSERLITAYGDWRFRNAAPTDRWKHAAPPPEDAEALAAAPVPQAFGDFLAMGWRPLRRDRGGRRRLTPLELWNARARACLRLLDALERDGNPGVQLRFEDFVADQAACYRRLAPQIAGARPEPEIVTESAKGGADWDLERRRGYCARREWLAAVSPADRAVINRGIDWRVAGRFGDAPLPGA